MDVLFGLVLLLVCSPLATAQTIYGCRYDPDLCNSIQSCEEDNLFGTCWSLLKRDPAFKFHVTPELKKVLVYSLKKLLALDYHWTDEYTQCIIGGLLQSRVDNITPELIDCDISEQQHLADLNGYLSLSNDHRPTARPSDVRLPLHTTTQTEDLLSGLSEADLKFIESYLSLSRPPLHIQPSSTPAEAAVEAADGEPKLSETDEWLLEQLTQERISVDDLSTSQIKRLKAYLQTILATSSKKPTSSDREQMTVRSAADTSTAATDSAVEDSEIEEVLRKFSAEAMNAGGSSESAKEKSKKVVGQQISDQMRLMEQEEIGQYVDKKAASVVKAGRIVEAPDKAPELTALPRHEDITPLSLVDTAYVWVELNRPLNEAQANSLVAFIAEKLKLDRQVFTNIKLDGVQVLFEVTNFKAYNTTEIATIVEEDLRDDIRSEFNVTVEATGIGNEPQTMLQIAPTQRVFMASDQTTVIIVSTVLVVVAVAVVILLTWRCMYRKWSHSVHKFEKLSEELRGESTQDSYEDLCRQRMQAGSEEKKQADLDEVSPLRSKPDLPTHQDRLKSPRSSTSSWSEEPVSLAMDISTGHTVLAYMEDHLRNGERLEEEWTALCEYTPDTCDVEVGKLNASNNRYASVLPYDHNRVKLENGREGGDYINASFVTDSDPRSPAYIATQGLLQSTVAHFWQMVWEQDSTSIVMLTSLAEDNKTVCYQYWPSEGRHTYGNYEVHLVSEHIWCEAYLVRSLYLKNLLTNQTRTVTQFHFLSWPDLGVPEHCEDLLAFRRKVNKSYRGKTSPIIVCCSDGSGRTGTYILLDTVINRIHKGVKEIDIAATLEHIRDQRMNAVQTKEQFEFVLSAIAEEVQALLKALPQ